VKEYIIKLRHISRRRCKYTTVKRLSFEEAVRDSYSYKNSAGYDWVIESVHEKRRKNKAGSKFRSYRFGKAAWGWCKNSP